MGASGDPPKKQRITYAHTHFVHDAKPNEISYKISKW